MSLIIFTEEMTGGWRQPYALPNRQWSGTSPVQGSLYLWQKPGVAHPWRKRLKTCIEMAELPSFPNCKVSLEYWAKDHQGAAAPRDRSPPHVVSPANAGAFVFMRISCRSIITQGGLEFAGKKLCMEQSKRRYMSSSSLDHLLRW